MTAKYSLSLFIFRRDLRLEDNLGLIAACRMSRKVAPVFIFDPRQVGKNSYKSNNAISFMLESLQDLDLQLRAAGGRLFCFEGTAEDVLRSILKTGKVDAVFINKDYTPFALRRDSALEKHCKGAGKNFHSFDDALLNAPGSVLKADGTPYTIFTPLSKAASKLKAADPKRAKFSGCFANSLADAKSISQIILPSARSNTSQRIRGGRKQALRLLSKLDRLEDYAAKRNLPALGWTSQLSAHNKFGTVSIREVYSRVQSRFGASHTLIQELYWRDFFTHIGFYFPHVFKGCFHKRYDKIKWENDRNKFQAWCRGKTGYPIVDAGMRELNSTGFMHNRARMITASFLTKDLHVDWRWGEKYFARNLVDYDPAVNNGNWQWAASTGCDAQPYFRIFNPGLQLERWDSDCVYVKRWVPELAKYSAREIKNLARGKRLAGYPAPIVEHSRAAARAEEFYRECAR